MRSYLQKPGRLVAWVSRHAPAQPLAFAAATADSRRLLTLMRREGLLNVPISERSSHIARILSECEQQPTREEPNSDEEGQNINKQPTVASLCHRLRVAWSPWNHFCYPERERHVVKTLYLVRQRSDSVLNAKTVLLKVLQLLVTH